MEQASNVRMVAEDELSELNVELESKPTSLEQYKETWSKKDSLGLSSKDLIAL